MSVNLRHGTDSFTSLPKGRRADDFFFRPEKSYRFCRVWTRELGVLKSSTPTPRPPKPLICMVTDGKDKKISLICLWLSSLYGIPINITLTKTFDGFIFNILVFVGDIFTFRPYYLYIPTVSEGDRSSIPSGAQGWGNSVILTLFGIWSFKKNVQNLFVDILCRNTSPVLLTLASGTCSE
jgi:hypothetical protein